MKYTLLLLFNCLLAFAQAPEEINKAVGLPDNLVNDEIRIYRKIMITNYTDIFRLYKINNEWQAERYQFHAAIKENNIEEHFEKTVLQSTKGFQQIWDELLNTGICTLPKENEIDTGDNWIPVNDGYLYHVYVNAGGIYNHISYANPEFYKRIKEYVSFYNLVRIVQGEFNILKDDL